MFHAFVGPSLSNASITSSGAIYSNLKLNNNKNNILPTILNQSHCLLGAAGAFGPFGCK